MKKRIFSFMAMLLCSVAVLAEEFEVDGIKYSVTSTTDPLTVGVISNDPKYSGDIVIPQKVEYNNEEYTVTSIGYGAFQYCSGLTAVTIPNSVTSIGENAFSGCSGLTSIDISNSVTSIENYTFNGCSSLTAATIPNSVTSIGYAAFRGCSGLTYIDIPNSVTSIGQSAFAGCSGLTSITIPNSVTSIGQVALQGCSGLTSVTVGTTTPVSINSNCFNDSNIANATLYVPAGCVEAYLAADNWKKFNKIEEFFTGIMTDGQGVKYTPNNDLTCYVSGHEDNCDATMVIPIALKGRTVSSIGNNAFENCSGLTSVLIQNSVTSIGSGAFSGCCGLTNVTVRSRTPIVITDDVFTNRANATLYVSAGCVDAYQAADNWKEFNKIEEFFTGTMTDGQGLIYTANSDGTTCYISGHEENYSTSIVIPKIFQGRIVTSVGYGAFSGCSGLTSVIIPSSVTSIEGSDYSYPGGAGVQNNPFWGCSSLTSIKVESGNTVYDSRNDCNAIIRTETNELIAGCQNTVMPNSVTSIGECAFFNYSSLTSIDIPNSVTSIGRLAFYGCSGLVSITIPNSVTSIGMLAFFGCSSLTSIDIPNSSIGNSAFAGCSSLTSVTIGNSVENIGGGAFENCDNLTSITIGNSVTSIEWGTFRGCIGLTSVTIPNSVTSIGTQAFSGCSGLTSVTIGNSVESIGFGAFQYCSGLTSLAIPNSVTSIGDGAFFNCRGLTSLAIPNSVTSIGYGAFAQCSGLTSITIPSSVTSIGEHTFSWCSGLTYLAIPNSVTSIGEFAFAYCSGLRSVTVGATTPIAINESCFKNSPKATLYVPKGSKAAYDDAEYWKDFKKIEELFTGTMTDGQGVKYTAISDIACSVTGHEYNFDASIDIPANFHGRAVSSIGGNVFEDCSGLTSIFIPISVTSIGSNAFKDCNNLITVTVPLYIPIEISDNVFSNSENATLYVPTGSVAIYQATDNWENFNIEELFTGIVDDEQGVKYRACNDGTCTISGYADSYNSSVVIPKIFQGSAVTSIGTSAFAGCSGLTSINISNSVTSIEGGAFNGCSGLTSITIPSSVTSIGDWAFERCSGLTSVVVGATTPIAINSSCFTNRANATLYVPKGSKAAYEAADYWKEFKEIIELGPEPISITMATSSGTAREMKGYSCAYGLDFNGMEDVKAYIAVGFSKDHTVYLSRVRVVPPNTGIVLKTTKPGITVEVPTTDEDAYWVNMLLPALSNVTVNPTETVDNVEYRNLMVGMITATNKMGFVEFSSPVVRSNNCYLRVPASFYDSSASARMMGALDMVFDDDGTTDIRSIDDGLESSDDNQVYDLQGRKVTTPRNGLVIKNGKLIFVKP